MATFRNRNGKWQARVVRKGQAPVAKSFQSKQDAERWGMITKNGEPRTVPLSTQPMTILNEIARGLSGFVFPINGPAVSAAFDNWC